MSIFSILFGIAIGRQLKRFFSIAAFVIFLFPLFAQSQNVIDKNLICNTWMLEKYQEADGKTYSPLPQQKNDYLKYNCDGTMESTEEGVLVKGKWTLNEKTATMTTTQSSNKNYPSKVIAKIIKLTDKELVIQGTDAGGEKLTMYLKPKK